MKTLARYLSTAVALGALLAFAGCTTQTARAVPSRTNYQVTVVESSKDLKLTEQQAAEIRSSAVAYLKENGLSRGGEFFVKVNLTPGSPEETDRWVVLRISSLPTRTYTLLAVYPGPDDSYPFDYYRFNGSYRYAGFGGYGYYDPFDYGSSGYYGGGYPSPTPPPHHSKPGDKDNHKPGDNDNHPPATHTRWDPNSPHPDTPRTWDRDHSSDNNSGSRWSGHRNSEGSSSSGSGSSSSSGSGSYSGSSSGSSYSPPPAPSYSPPPAPSYSPPPAPTHDTSSSRTDQKQPE